jgi:hypothetical protein
MFLQETVTCPHGTVDFFAESTKPIGGDLREPIST